MESAEIEHRVGLAALAGEVTRLVTSHGEIKELLQGMAKQMTALELQTAKACKDCDLRERVRTIELSLASITGRAAGLSIGAGFVTSALGFLAMWFARR